MLILASNNDRLQIITGSAGTIDVHASWMDNVSGAVAPGRTNTLITTAATTVVVGGPAVGTFRSVKTLHIYNKGTASAGIAVTVVHTDGTTAVEIHKVTIPPGANLQYIDEIGFVLSIAGATAGVAGMKKLIAQKNITTPVNRVDFVNEINSAYIEYELHALGIRVNNDAWAALRVSKNRGATWEADPIMQYGHAWQYWDVAGNNSFHGGWDDSLWLNNDFAPTILDSFAIFTFHISFAYPQKNGSRKQFLAEAQGDSTSGSPQRLTIGGEFWDDTHSNPEVNGVRFMLMPDGGPANIIGGTFNFYGTRG